MESLGLSWSKQLSLQLEAEEWTFPSRSRLKTSDALCSLASSFIH